MKFINRIDEQFFYSSFGFAIFFFAEKIIVNGAKWLWVQFGCPFIKNKFDQKHAWFSNCCSLTANCTQCPSQAGW